MTSTAVANKMPDLQAGTMATGITEQCCHLLETQSTKSLSLPLSLSLNQSLKWLHTLFNLPIE